MHGASFLLQTNTHRDVSNVSRSKDHEGGKGMVVLVTGASRGIGRTLAAAAARERHDVVVYCLKNAAQANALVSELACWPSRVIAIKRTLIADEMLIEECLDLGPHGVLTILRPDRR